jgi:hypothetical protein
MKKRFLKTALAGGLVLALGLFLAGCENPAGDSGDSGTPLTGAVTLSGLPRIGETLTADAYGLDGEGELAYTWIRGDTEIAGVSGDTYDLTEDDALEYIKVRVTRQGYTGSVESNAVGKIDADPFTTIEAVSAYLETTYRGTAEALVYVPVEIQLTAENWEALITALEASTKLVNLDLSLCTPHFGSNSAAGLHVDGTFRANWIESTAVVKLTLPDYALILPTASGSAYNFARFAALKEIRGRNIHTLMGLTNAAALVSASFPRAKVCASGTFSGCTSLSEVDLPGLITITGQAFYNCTALVSLRLPASYTFTQATTFTGAKNLTDLTVDPANPTLSAVNGMLLSKDGTTLYSYPGAAGNVTLPDTITRLGGQAFSGTNIESVNLSGVTVFDGIYIFSNCTSLTTVDAPLLTAINGGYSFQNCTSLAAVHAPLLTALPERTFWGTSALAALIIPSVGSFGTSVFQDSGADTALTITLGAEPPTLGTRPFNTCAGKTVTVKVPADALSRYDTTWQNSLKRTSASASALNLTVEAIAE